MAARQYVLRATYRGERVDVVQALQGANWAILLDGVPVSVSGQSLSDFRSERLDDVAAAIADQRAAAVTR